MKTIQSENGNALDSLCMALGHHLSHLPPVKKHHRVKTWFSLKIQKRLRPRGKKRRAIGRYLRNVTRTVAAYAESQNLRVQLDQAYLDTAIYGTGVITFDVPRNPAHKD